MKIPQVSIPVQMRTRAAVVWDAAMAVLAVLSVLMVVWHERGGIGPFDADDLVLIDFFVVALFIGDWIWWYRRAESKRLYLRRNWWDLLGLVPLYFSGVGFLRVFRLFRLFRILRAVRVMNRFFTRLRTVATESKLGYLGAISLTITMVGALLVWAVERNDPRSNLHDFGETLWWAVVTVTTVGYGDHTPVTLGGRIVAAGLMLTGIGTIAVLASQVSVFLIRDQGTEIMEETVAHGAPHTMAGQLAAIADLHDTGKLTDDEYQRAKERVLAA